MLHARFRDRFQLLPLVLLAAISFIAEPASAEVMTFRCTVMLKWALKPSERLIVVDTERASVVDGTLLWIDRHSGLHGDGVQRVQAGPSVIEWGTIGRDNFRIDKSNGQYTYDNEIKNFGRGSCRNENAIS